MVISALFFSELSRQGGIHAQPFGSPGKLVRITERKARAARPNITKAPPPDSVLPFPARLDLRGLWCGWFRPSAVAASIHHDQPGFSATLHWGKRSIQRGGAECRKFGGQLAGGSNPGRQRNSWNH